MWNSLCVLKNNRRVFIFTSFLADKSPDGWIITILKDDSFLIGETTMNLSDLIKIILALAGEGTRVGGYFISAFS